MKTARAVFIKKPSSAFRTPRSALLVALFCSAFIGAPLQAVTRNASNCSQSAVQTQVDASQDGDTVVVPAGNCTWNSPLVLNKNITLQGAGIDQTTIVDQTYVGEGNHPGVIRWQLDPVGGSPAGFARLTGFTIDGGSGPGEGQYLMHGHVNFSGSTPNLRVDHNRFIASRYPAAYFIEDVRGVIDNNILDLSGSLTGFDISHASWKGVGRFADNSWAQPSTMGTVEAMYFENNTCNGSIAGAYGFAEFIDDHGGGGRFVARFNNFKDCQISNHGTDSGGRLRGSRHWEYYNNTGQFGVYGSYYFAMSSTRGGTGLVFNNTASGSIGEIFVASHNRASTYNSGFWPFAMCGTRAVSLSASGGTATANFSEDWGPGQGAPATYLEIVGASQSAYNGVKQGTWLNSRQFQFSVSGSPGSASGSARSPWDGNSDTNGYPCLDQFGSGQADDFQSVDVPTPAWPHQQRAPVYIWGNTINGNSKGLANVYSPHVIVRGRDYFEGTGSASVSGGMGVGTLGQRPSSCNTNEGYWATDQGNWNQSGNGQGNGVLYKCTSPNTWTQFYQPFVYPHPLVSGAPVINNAQISCNGAASCSVLAGSSVTIAWNGNTGATSCGVTLNGSSVGTSLSGSISPTLTQTSTYTLTCSGGSGTRTSSVIATVTQPKFLIGGRVRVVAAGALARSSPGFGTGGSGDNLLGSHVSGELGTVIGGPQTADGYIWWNVNYDSGADGWTTEPNIDVYIAVANSTCDVNADGATNVSDVQGIVNQALGIAACVADINLDRLCNVIDVQRVVNAALGAACVSP